MPNLLINIDVPDLSQAIEFYTRAFGFRVGRRLGPNAIEMLGAACPLYLLQANEQEPPFAGTRVRRSYERHWTPVHLDVVVDDLAATLLRVLAAGARLEGAVIEYPWGKLARLADPFGHGICLLQFIGRGYDELASEHG